MDLRRQWRHRFPSQNCYVPLNQKYGMYKKNKNRFWIVVSIGIIFNHDWLGHMYHVTSVSFPEYQAFQKDKY